MANLIEKNATIAQQIEDETVNTSGSLSSSRASKTHR